MKVENEKTLDRKMSQVKVRRRTCLIPAVTILCMQVQIISDLAIKTDDIFFHIIQISW